MTSFQVEEFPFDLASVQARLPLDSRYGNWPVVYTLTNAGEIYVGESINVAGRLRQHLESPTKKHLTGVRVVLDATFNKSASLDLESYLIRLLAGDGQFQVLNRNEGITNADYYGRAEYQRTFDEVFDELRRLGMFTRQVREIENSDLFKLSPFKALTADQELAIENILNGLFEDLAAARTSEIVIQGDPGTGKTVVGIYLMKLLSDIEAADPTIEPDSDTLLSEFFVEGYAELLRDFRVGLVVPQQSLRTSIQKVFRKTPGLDATSVLTPFQVGASNVRFDLLIVDEMHRLNQRANQPSGPQNRQFIDINEKLFGADDPSKTQLDWIRAQSDHRIFLLDAAQSVIPADLSRRTINEVVARASAGSRRYRLSSQMRVAAGSDYVGYIRGMLSGQPPAASKFPLYDLRFFGDAAELRRQILARNSEVGLSRLVAGYAWEWRSKNDRTASDIELDGLRLQWNQTQVDWVNSPSSINEVGSIHTIQGYDLNYAGVIIGNDLRYDPQRRVIVFDRTNYFDARGKQNNKQLGITYSDDDLLQFIVNIYAVLLTRGILGTYVYVCDPHLREYLKPYFSQGESS
ncbi:MAG: DUF2075 domain-containing protein [Frankiaceae bacterium]|nr:DUF2075 domain-containing protein [Frankiaceae bacterium]